MAVTQVGAFVNWFVCVEPDVRAIRTTAFDALVLIYGLGFKYIQVQIVLKSITSFVTGTALQLAIIGTETTWTSMVDTIFESHTGRLAVTLSGAFVNR
jgi:hypothetical protein